MKKVFLFIAAAVMAAASCQKESASSVDAGNVNAGSRRLTATFAQTKVSYTEVDNAGNTDLQPAWEEGDKIIVFDDAGNTYTLTVSSVSVEGIATLSGTVPDDVALHLIYKSGAQEADIQENSLAVSYVDQAGDKTMPAVMLSDGTVSDGSADFTFSNAGAVIGICNAKGVPAESAISKVTISGSDLSGATVGINDNALALTATQKANDAISTVALSGITVTNGETGALSKEILIAVPAGAKVSKVTLTVGDDTYSSSATQAKTCVANDYLYVKTQQFEKDVVLPKGALPGVFSVSTTKKVRFSKGNLWADSNNALHFEANQYSYSSASNKDASHVSHFTWSSTVSDAVGSSYSGTYLFCDESHKVSVDESDKIYYALSNDEWTYLFSNHSYKWVTVNGVNGYVIAPDGFTGTLAESYNDDAALSTDNLVFLPAAGYCAGSIACGLGVDGRYWSSTPSGLYGAYRLKFGSGSQGVDSYSRDNNGFSVRPVSNL